MQVFRPAWLRRGAQTALHVYLFDPRAGGEVRRSGRRSVAAPGNPARETPAVRVNRRVTAGELVSVDVAPDGLAVDPVDPLDWEPPWIRFLVPVRAPARMEPGTRRPVVTLSTGAGTGRRMLAQVECTVDVVDAAPARDLVRIGLLVGAAGAGFALATLTATDRLEAGVGYTSTAGVVAGSVAADLWLRVKAEPSPLRCATTVTRVAGAARIGWAIGTSSTDISSGGTTCAITMPEATGTADSRDANGCSAWATSIGV